MRYLSNSQHQVREPLSPREALRARTQGSGSHGLTSVSTLEQRRRRVVTRRDAAKLIIATLGAAATAYAVLGVVLGIAVVRGGSMQPAYEDGDVVLFFRLAGTYDQGDVVLVRAHGRVDANTQSVGFGQVDLVKRVVAVPGDQVDVRNGAVWVNGTKLDEPYAQGTTTAKTGQSYPVTLSGNEYFVLGDNRSDSADSRNYGPVQAADIDGKAIAVARAA